MIIKIKKYLQSLFKKISYSFFHLIYGKVIFDDNFEKDNSDITQNIVRKDGNREYKIFKLKGSRLYTDRIHNTALIKDNVLISGPSYKIENNNFANKNNIVLKIGTPRFIRKIKGKILSLLTGGGGNNNYFHWLFDVLPRIEIFNQLYNIEDIDFLLIPSYSKRFQKETLNLLDFDSNKILSSVTYRHIQANEIFVTQHPYRLNDFYKDELNMPIWISNWLKLKFLNKIKYSKNSFPRKIYIDRKDSDYQGRKIINEDEIKNYLENEGFKFLQLSKYSFIDQIKIFSEAETVVGLHGGGFANIVFCKANTKILEFRTQRTGQLFENIGVQNKLNFEKIECIPDNPGAVDQQGHIKVNIEEIKKKLSN